MATYKNHVGEEVRVCVFHSSYTSSCRKHGACGAPLGAAALTVGHSARSRLITPNLINVLEPFRFTPCVRQSEVQSIVRV